MARTIVKSGDIYREGNKTAFKPRDIVRIGQENEKGEKALGSNLSIKKRDIPENAIESVKKINNKAPLYGLLGLTRGEISLKDAAKEIPKTIMRGGKSLARTFSPAVVSNFVTETGSIFGEGIAYAIDPKVRKAYTSVQQETIDADTKLIKEIQRKRAAGEDTSKLIEILKKTQRQNNLDILPYVTKTTPLDIVKSTVAAGIEVATYKAFPASIQKQLFARGGLGALEGLGFAIGEGLATDQTPEEIAKNAALYGVTGSVLNIISPYLSPLLVKEVKVVPKGVRSLFKRAGKEATEEIAEKPLEIGAKRILQESVGEPIETTTKSSAKRILKESTEQIEPRITEVPTNRLPIESEGKTKVSKLEARMTNTLNKVDPKRAEIEGISTFKQMNKKDQISKAVKYVEKNPDDALAVLRGEKIAPEGLLDNSIAIALEKKALLESDRSLSVKLASLRSTRAGQEISILTEIDPTNPINQMNDIIKARTDKAVKNLKSGETIQSSLQKSIKEASDEMTKTQLKIADAEALLDSILC